MASPPTLPESFGRYQVQGLLGEGAMGRVYRGFDPLARRVVAIKTLKSEYLTSETRHEYLRRFQREAQAAGTLSHPHIVTIYDVGEGFFVMELLEGVSLQELLQQRGMLSVEETLGLLAPVADALDYAHGKGTIHRDIKPANIMILPNGLPKLMDFGVAHLSSTAMTTAGQILGSPSYMAPEQILESGAGASSDLYSLAVVSYEMLTGHRPIAGESVTAIIYRVVHEDPQPPRLWREDLPPRFDAIFARALSKDPAQRFPSARAFLAALELREVEEVLESAFPVLPAGPEPSEVSASSLEPQATLDLEKPPPPPSARGRWGLATAAVVLAVGVATVVYLREGPLVPTASPLAPTPVPPAPPAGLRVETEPPAATVWVDGQEVGASPLTIEGLVSGNHAVKVSRPGFAPAQVNLELTVGQAHAPLRFVLQPVSSTLTLQSQPADAAVRVDGKAVGPAPLQALLLDPGPHDVRVERKGFKPWTRRVETRAGETLDLLAHLDALPPGRPAGPEPKAEATPDLREGDLVALTPDVTPPKRIAGDPATYPEAARRLRLDGVVTVDVLVTEAGEASAVRVVESAGEILDQAVVAAVKGWRFEPAVKNGVKVRVHWLCRQRFQSGG
jgi:serine/threonine-protein kinase